MRVAFTNALAIESSAAARSVAPAPLKVIRMESPHASIYEKICLSCAEGTHFVSWKEIARCEAINNYCRIHLVSGKIIFIAKTLKNIEALLPENVFIRIHRSHLIRMDLVSMVTSHTIDLVNGTVLPLAKKRQMDIQNLIKNYCHV